MTLAPNPTSTEESFSSIGEPPRLSQHVVLISQAPLEREGLKLLLEQSGLSVTITAAALDDIDEDFSTNDVLDLVLVDVAAEDEPNGWVERLKALRLRSNGARIVLLANRMTLQWLVAAWQVGLDGYLSKDRAPEIFNRQLSLILAGERVFPFDLVRRYLNGEGEARLAMCEPALPSSISSSEVELLRYILAGFRNKVIARSLNIRESTVKVRVKSVFQKIHAANRTQAAVWALNHGIQAVQDSGKGGNLQN